ncbi:MAG: hypothetical protein U9N73_11555, partial [Candidatus Auribacterota bacterium]|nr:hypothetical protein [Candidatus Auribacterota bacterium]
MWIKLMIGVFSFLVAFSGVKAFANFSGGDDFNDGVINPGKWGSLETVNSGMLTESNQRLRYSCQSAHAPDQAFLPWKLNYGSYLENWSVFWDVQVPNIYLVDDEEVWMELRILDTGNSDNYAWVVLAYSHYGGALERYFSCFLNSDHTGQHSYQKQTATAITASLRIKWEASSKTLFCDYDEDGGADNWTNLTSWEIGSGNYDWSMTDSDTFTCKISGGSNYTLVGISENVDGDNFVAAGALPPTATPTLTPEGYKTPTPTPSPGSHAPPWIYDYDGDGTSDIAVFRGDSGLWAVRGVTRVYFGGSTDETIPGDYDGDGTTDIGVFRPASGLWAIRGVTRAYFGSGSDLPEQGDYDGDGTADIGIFRAASGLWAIRGVTRAYFGGSTDEPVPGYYDADGS